MYRKGQEWYEEEEVAEEYDETRFTGGGRLLDKREKQKLLSMIEPEGKTILDIATGTGRFAELLCENGADVVGLDASREMLSSGEAQYLVGDALSLPFADKSFDMTISMRFIHLLTGDDIPSFIEEVARVTEERFVFESLHPLSLRLSYQWALPQGSHLYSNSFLKKQFEDIPVVKEIEYDQTFLVPYGLYQIMPLKLAEAINRIDRRAIDKHPWLSSTVYWSLSF